jgi:hypothetical protein
MELALNFFINVFLVSQCHSDVYESYHIFEVLELSLNYDSVPHSREDTQKPTDT